MNIKLQFFLGAGTIFLAGEQKLNAVSAGGAKIG